VSTTPSEPQTVKFHGIDDLVLVADEWNGGAPSADGAATVLMLHGGGQNRFSWKNTGQILADEGLHVVANKEYAAANPKVAAMLSKFKLTDEQYGSLEDTVVNKFPKGQEEEAARAWLKANPGFADQLAASLKS